MMDTTKKSIVERQEYGFFHVDEKFVKDNKFNDSTSYEKLLQHRNDTRHFKIKYRTCTNELNVYIRKSRSLSW